MKLLGLDLGSRTCGIAISDAMGMIARTLETFRFKDDDYDTCVDYVYNICLKEGISKVVLGYPKHMNGDKGLRAQISEDFKKKLEEKSSKKIEVVLWDERLSTVSADRAMLAGNVRREKRREKKDELAAVVILQNYLDYRSF